MVALVTAVAAAGCARDGDGSSVIRLLDGEGDTFFGGECLHAAGRRVPGVRLGL